MQGEFRQIAFAFWNGGKNESGSRKAVSSWWYFQTEASPDKSIWVYTLGAVLGAVLFEVVLVRRIRKRSENA